MSSESNELHARSKQNTKSRISILGLLKFFASLFIVWRHMRFILGTDTYRFNSSYIFVEFFLMISGYFAYRFARTLSKNDIEYKVSSALSYAKKQYLSLLPLIAIGTLISLVVCIIIEQPTYRGIFELIKENIFSVLPFAAFIRGENVPIWYLSAYILVLPLFILFASSKKYKLTTLIVSVITICYYGSMPYPYTSGMGCLLRAFVGLSCGIIIDALTREIKNLKLKGSTLILVFGTSILAVLLLIAPRDANYLTGNCSTPLVIVLFMLILSILFSGGTSLSSARSKVLDFLESISTIIYLVHYPIILLLADFVVGATCFERVILVYAVTLVFSLVIKVISIYLNKIIKNKNGPTNT